MSEGGEDPRIIQVRTEGKIDRLGDKVDRFQTDIIDVRERVHRNANELMILRGRFDTHADHPERITALETDKTLRDGKQQGIITSGRLAWGVVTVALSGGTMALVRLLTS